MLALLERMLPTEPLAPAEELDPCRLGAEAGAHTSQDLYDLRLILHAAQ